LHNLEEVSKWEDKKRTKKEDHENHEEKVPYFWLVVLEMHMYSDLHTGNFCQFLFLTIEPAF
jgi:hypothetical protein